MKIPLVYTLGTLFVTHRLPKSVSKGDRAIGKVGLWMQSYFYLSLTLALVQKLPGVCKAIGRKTVI